MVSDLVNSRSSSKAFRPNALAKEDKPCRRSADEVSMPLAKEMAACISSKAVEKLGAIHM